MKRRFNSVGVCVSRKHYMVNISDKLKQIKELIDNEFYFTINRPRQYGKTTTINELSNYLKEDYLVIDISFEGIGDSAFDNEKKFCTKFLKIMSKSLHFTDKEESERLLELSVNVDDLEETSEVITKFIENAKKDVVLFIDVVITYNNFKYIIEMKIWRGPKYHEDGIKQLSDYLDINELNQGFLLIFNFNKNKEFKEERIKYQGKEIFEIYV